MDEKPFESMNVIPFVDIMLVLLTIVLTTSSFIATGKLPINLPQASVSEPETRKEIQLVEISRSQGLHLNGHPTTVESMRAEIAGLDKETPFLVRADRDIQLQSFIDVVDLLKQVGFSKVAVQTEAKRGGAADNGG